LPCNIGINAALEILTRGEENGEGSGEHISQGCHDTIYNEVDSDSKMSVEKFDDVAAMLTLTATVVTIALGFLFNL
jgi:hypothetical protein